MRYGGLSDLVAVLHLSQHSLQLHLPPRLCSLLPASGIMSNQNDGSRRADDDVCHRAHVMEMFMTAVPSMDAVNKNDNLGGDEYDVRGG